MPVLVLNQTSQVGQDTRGVGVAAGAVNPFSLNNSSTPNLKRRREIPHKYTVDPHTHSQLNFDGVCVHGGRETTHRRPIAASPNHTDNLLDFTFLLFCCSSRLVWYVMHFFTFFAHFSYLLCFFFFFLLSYLHTLFPSLLFFFFLSGTCCFPLDYLLFLVVVVAVTAFLARPTEIINRTKPM